MINGGVNYKICRTFDDPINYGLIKINLSKDEQNVIDVVPLLMNDPLMNIPTTIDVVADVIYILANSQMENLNQETNEIIDSKLLTNTFVIKYPLKEENN